MLKIVFTGGGTAGHIMPNLAIIENLKNCKIYYFGSDGMEKNILSKYKNITFVEIPSVKFIRSFTLKNLKIPFKLIKSISYCRKKLEEIKPNLIFSKGGYVSIPVALAGSKLGINILTHESDLSIGLANKIIARKSKHICCSFKETASKYGKNSIFTGSPIRKKILQGNKSIIIKRHNIKENKPIITIVGGSLGAQAINEIIWNNIEKLTNKYNIIHIVGKGKLKKEYNNKSSYIQIEFADDIENYFKASDLVITRAGSNTIFELLAIQKPMILIPLPKKSSRGDQLLNAEIFKKQKFAKVILQENLDINTLESTINNTLINKSTYINNMKQSQNYNGNKKIEELIYIYSK